MPAKKSVATKRVEVPLDKPGPSDREVRLESLKLAIEMRAGVTRAPDIIAVADEFYQYVEDGLN